MPRPKSPACQLADKIIAYDEDHPGEHDAPMEVDAETWAELVDLAGQVESQET